MDLSNFYQRNQPYNVGSRQFIRPQPDHPPACERGLQVFFQVGGETRTAVVAPVHVDATLDLDERAAGHVGEVGPPFANRVKGRDCAPPAAVPMNSACQMKMNRRVSRLALAPVPGIY